jgi:predicted NBD/HSP70 family sugar kinase
MGRFIGLDIGGTKFMVAAADRTGQVLGRVRASAPADPEEGLSQLRAMVHEVLAGDRAVAIGASVGGPLDWRTGVVSPLHQPGWQDVPLAADMEAAFGCSCQVDVDTNMASLGEYHFGGEKASRLLYLTLSTGMGGGFLVDGQLFRGSDGGHPEVAHMSVHHRVRNPAGVRCECGSPDCLEALVSGNGVRRVYGRPAEELDEASWDEVSYNLGQGLRNLATIYYPDVIVLGGGLAIGRGEKLVREAGTVMRDLLRLVPAPALRLSHLGYDTALLGAIAAALYGLR